MGKGGKVAEQELYPGAVEAAEASFHSQFQRTPDPCDWLFYSLENFYGRQPGLLIPPTFGACVHELGRPICESQIVRRDLQFSPHRFRRIFATLYYRETRDLKKTQLVTRHFSVEVLMNHYVDSTHGTSEVVTRILS
jgi:hypothetical protein